MPVSWLTVQVHHSHDFYPARFRLMIHQTVRELPQQLAPKSPGKTPPSFGMLEDVTLSDFNLLFEFPPELLLATVVIPRGIHKLHAGLRRVGQPHLGEDGFEFSADFFPAVGARFATLTALDTGLQLGTPGGR